MKTKSLLTDLVCPQDEGEVKLALEPKFSERNERDIIQIPFSVEYGITNDFR